MNNTGYILCGAGVGAGVGAAVAWFFTRRHYINKFVEISQTMAQMEINEYKESLGKKVRKSETENLEKELKDKVEEIVDDISANDMIKSHSSIGDEYRTSTPDTFDYSKMYQKKDPGELMAETQHPQDDDEEPEIEDTRENETRIKNEQQEAERQGDILTKKNPRVISMEEYFEENDNYEKTVMYYYSDNVLAYENDEMVDDFDYILGDIDLNGATYGQIIYIRNDRLAADYEINVVEASYEETVDGIGPDWADEPKE